MLGLVATRILDLNSVFSWLDDEDDPQLWLAVLRYVHSGEWRPKRGDMLEIGRCSHWLRPHQTRWTADGGFALPVGYADGTGFSRRGLPEFDWSARVTWDGTDWVFPVAYKELDGREPDLRLAIPSRTTHHKQAAIHARWRLAKEFKVEFYGFRLKPEGWLCTADTTLRKDLGKGRKPRRHRDG